MTDFLTYKQNKEKNELKTCESRRELIEQQEKQLELYENNTKKTNIEAYLELAKQYHNNKTADNREYIPLTTEDLAGDFNLL